MNITLQSWLFHSVSCPFNVQRYMDGTEHIIAQCQGSYTTRNDYCFIDLENFSGVQNNKKTMFQQLLRSI